MLTLPHAPHTYPPMHTYQAPGGPYKYFALHSGNICMYGNALPPRTTAGEWPVPQACLRCTGPGETDLYCGNGGNGNGQQAQSVYVTGRAFAPPAPAPSSCGYTWFGCFPNAVSVMGVEGITEGVRSV